MKLVNPQVKVVILSEPEIEIADAYIEFSVSKTLDEMPNECDLVIHNLNEDYRNAISLACLENAPVSLFLTGGGVEGQEPKLAYTGDLVSSDTDNLYPGVATTIRCESQFKNHREFYIQKSYVAGTKINQILNDLVSAVALPAGNTYDFPTNEMKIGESFFGGAFQLLERYAHDLGQYAYIADGKLFITDVYDPPRLDTFVIDDSLLYEPPRTRVKTDRRMIQKKAIVENDIRSVRKNKRGKRRKKKTKVQGKNDLVEYEAVDSSIRGVDFNLYCSPQIQIDDIVQNAGNIYRVSAVTHGGDSDGGEWVTELETEEYNHYLVYVPSLLKEDA
jgi:hypothetical protein